MPYLGLGLGMQRVRSLFRGLLDQFDGAAAAYSLRKLSSSTTNVVRVRRSSDDTEQDFTANQVSDGSLTTFCGAGDGFVTTWYDQSGNSNDATQTTTTAQPQIVASGALVTGGLDFDGTNSLLNIASAGSIFQSVGYGCAYSVCKNDSATGFTQVVFYAENGAAGGTRFRFGNEGTNEFGLGSRRLDADSFVTATTTRTANKVLLTAEADWSNGAGAFYLNGAEVDTLAFAASGNTSNTPSDDVAIGRIAETGTAGFDGQIAELIVYNTDNSVSRDAIESNIASAYGITLA